MISNFLNRNLEDLRSINHCYPAGWTKAEMFKMKINLHTLGEVCVSDSTGPDMNMCCHIYHLLYYDMLYCEENKSW